MQRRGFTVVELLLVIVVIAILTTITIVAFNGIRERTYMGRAESEMASIAKSIQLYYTFEKSHWPADVDRNTAPAGLTQYMNGDISTWPSGPWPGSTYDYDNFTGSDGNPVVQISVRFCPISGTLSSCKFPNEAWANGFQVNSSAYWCITGVCRAHPTESDSYPGYCMNCRND